IGAVVLLASSVPAEERHEADRRVAALVQAPAVKAALAAARAGEAQTIDTQVRLSEIPAPPFHEGARAEEMRRLFGELGLAHVRIDKVGNVIGERPGAAPHPHVVIAAHLDTVFPAGTNLTVRRDGTRLYGPGIGDDSRGLAVLTGIVRALNAGHVRTTGTLSFVADVGEEGLGDLRGIRTLFDDTLKGTVDRFVTIDGTGLGIARTFVGSERYRITFRGPGGHSFAAFGTPNPVNALGRAIAAVAGFAVPPGTLTTFNVGRVGGGTAVNAIPAEAWMEVDLRSLDGAALRSLDRSLAQAVASALAAENARAGRGGALTVSRVLAGRRPGGAVPEGALIVQLAAAATRAIGEFPAEVTSSSDANYPASLGIPSLEIGGGGRGLDAHAPTEAFDTANAWLGTQRALLLAVALAEK
ncbi:MAG: M20/M25/M40 family metallo-hydrolase, partial [Acidobacteriota bacterium]